jgi:hypothetical protein
MDEKQILQLVEDVWHHHCSALEEALDETIRALRNLLRLDEYHRHGHEEEQLEQSLGKYGSSNLNLSSLSKVLSSSASTRSMPRERLQRVNGLLEKLEETRKICAGAPADYPRADIDEEESAIHEKAEAHLNHMAGIFSSIRMAQLEIRSKYNPAAHDPVFTDFTWRQLSPSELRMCPPFLILARLGSQSGEALRKIMSLLESRKPFKIAALRSTLRKEYSPTSDPSVPATMAVETLPLAMRGVYLLQTCVAEPQFAKHIFEALTSPRPTLLSLLASKEDEDEAGFRLRAERAMRSRAFPFVVYDPDRARGFVSCFDLSWNPQAGETYTFADFAAGEEDYAGEFSDPPAEARPDDLVPISEFLELTRHQRLGKLPCVYAPGKDGQSVPMVVSPAVVTQTSDQVHLWKTLQEIAGTDNPHVKSTKDDLQAAFGAEQKALEEKMRNDLERKLADREKQAVSNTIRQIVARFTGVDPGNI